MTQVTLSKAVHLIGTDPDPAKRMRREWADSLSDTMQLRAMSRKELQHRLAELNVTVSVQAIGQWLRAETMPKVKHQGAIAAVLGQPVRRLFPVEAAA